MRSPSDPLYCTTIPDQRLCRIFRTIDHLMSPCVVLYGSVCVLWAQICVRVCVSVCLRANSHQR